MMRALLLAILILLTALHSVAAQEPWREFAANMPIGSTVKVRLADGRRFDAVLVAVQQEGLLLQPKTREPLPVQPLPYSSIASLERIEPAGGMSAAKAIAIGAAAGAGVFFAILLGMLSALE